MALSGERWSVYAIRKNQIHSERMQNGDDEVADGSKQKWINKEEGNDNHRIIINFRKRLELCKCCLSNDFAIENLVACAGLPLE